MKRKFTFLGVALVLLAFLAIPLGMRGQTTVTWPGTTALPGSATAVDNDQNVTIKVSSTNTYSNPIRIYANTTVTINALNGAKILSVNYVASSTGNYVTYAQNATVTPQATPTVSGTNVVWTYGVSDNVTEFTFKPSSQTRCNSISITYTTGSNNIVAAPVINPNGGNFLESQEVSISCPTEGATIYYTTNGDTPSTSSTQYTNPFTITATTTVKAFAVKTNYTDSSVVTATFTKTTPMTVAEARTFIDGLNGATSDFEFVTGIISRIDSYNTTYHSITYWISDDGTTTDQLEAYGGISGIDGWTFNSIDDINVGATVIISGKLKKYNGIYEFDLNNQLISYTAPAITVATPTFSPAAGTYTEIQTVAISCENEGADIFYTLDGSIPNDESTPYSTPIEVSETTTIKAIAYYEDYASAVATAQYVINLPYSGPAYARVDNVSYLTEGVKVIFAARYDAEQTTQYYAMTNTATGKPTGVHFISTTSGDFEVLPDDILNTENSYCWTVGITENGYTFTNAQGQTIGWSSSTNFANGDNTDWIVENGTSGEAAMVPNYMAFNIKNQSTINASIVRSFALNENHNFGPYALSNNNSASYNFSIDIFVQGAEPVASPSINASDVEIAYDATSGSIVYAIVNPVTGTALTASTNASWISNLTVGENAVTFTTTVNEGNEDRTATVTLTYGSITEDITITQHHYVIDYAELPFEWEGGARTDFLALNGVTAEGLGSDYNADYHTPYLIKFDTSGDYIQVKCNQQPGRVTIGVKMIGGSDTSTIIIQGSADGETFTNIEELTISGDQNDTLILKTTNAFDENDRYVKLLFNKGSNVGVGPITIALPSTEPIITVTPATVDLTAESFVFGNETAFSISYQNIEDATYESFGIQFYDANGEETEMPTGWLNIGVTGTNDLGFQVSGYADANTGEARSAYFKVYSGQTYSNLVTINQAAAPQQYTLTIEPYENLEIFTFIDDELTEPMEGAGTMQVTEGVNVMLSVSAIEGYIIESLMVDGVEHVNDISDDLTYTFIMPSHNVTVSATAVEFVAPDNYVRITSLDQLTDGCKVIIAARYNQDFTQGYYAMSSETSGRPQGVSFTSEISGEDEIIPATLAVFENNYYWTVTVTDTSYTFTNAEGNKIGYSNSTTFATNGNNTEWNIEIGTAGSNTMVPEYEGFVITNKNNDGRAFAFNGSVFGAYAKTNMTAGGYNFFLDLFVQTENTPTTVTQTIELANGYNVVSVNVNATLEDIKAALLVAFDNADGIKIIAQNGSSSTYVANRNLWRGNITEWDSTKGLTVYAPAATTNDFTLEGESLANTAISLAPGYNLITFTGDVETPFATAIAGFVPVNGDMIIAPDGNSATYNSTNNSWRGRLSNQNLKPGVGYTIFNADSVTRSITFQTSGK